MSIREFRETMLGMTGGKVDVIKPDGKCMTFNQLVASLSDIWCDLNEDTKKNISELILWSGNIK